MRPRRLVRGLIALAYAAGLCLPYDAWLDEAEREQHAAWHQATDALEQAPPCPFHVAAGPEAPEPPGWAARCPCGCGTDIPGAAHRDRAQPALTPPGPVRLRPGPQPVTIAERAASRPGHPGAPEPVPIASLLA